MHNTGGIPHARTIRHILTQHPKKKNAESRSGASSRLNTDEAVSGAVSLVETARIESFSHKSLGKDTAPMRMEQMRKVIVFEPASGKETVTMLFEWEMARR
jgi:hypothetical protein